MLYGWSTELERSGNDYYAHKTCFTPESIRDSLLKNGFSSVLVNNVGIDIIVIAFKDVIKENTAVKRVFGEKMQRRITEKMFDFIAKKLETNGLAQEAIKTKNARLV